MKVRIPLCLWMSIVFLVMMLWRLLTEGPGYGPLLRLAASGALWFLAWDRPWLYPPDGGK